MQPKCILLTDGPLLQIIVVSLDRLELGVAVEEGGVVGAKGLAIGDAHRVLDHAQLLSGGDVGDLPGIKIREAIKLGKFLLKLLFFFIYSSKK